MLLNILFQLKRFINMVSKSIKFALLPLYVDFRNYPFYPFKGNSGHVRLDRFFHPFLKYFLRTSVKLL